MRRYSPEGGYRSPPRRGYRSPPRRGHGYGGGGGGGGSRRDNSTCSLLVRNIPMNTRAEDLRVPFERFGPVRDVYLPKDYYTGEPRGFAFVEYLEAYDASEAQYHMNRQIFGGREITVVLAAESRKRPEDMRRRGRSSRGSHGYESRGSYYARRSRSHSYSRSPSPRYRDRRSRSYSPAPKRRENYSVSPRHSRSPRERLDKRRSERSPPRGSRSRSADLSPGRSR
ncbi:hypothetical protein LUZ63_019583 [Rhynchospora breviuscula]|uniref:RRM domain-containing protein n=1 Tax=Rhynchospora breviuscula TaxID=2022672 RepID=A0A9Q0C6G4_9POAL|nr:hypothetical protein LUZ63_019583 [Rhynchospora breviuscula]